MRSRVAVRSNLAKRVIIQWTAALCAFCQSEAETCEHHFLHCEFSWQLWSHWINMWGISWSIPKTFSLLLLAWFEALPTAVCDKLWKMAFFAIVWTIWLARNEVVFNGLKCQIEQVIDLSRLRLAHWVKAKWPHLQANGLDIFRFPNIVTLPVKELRARSTTPWIGPDVGTLKFNVDVSAVGNPGPAGIGGILRDHLGVKKIAFSKSIGIADSNLADLLAHSGGPHSVHCFPMALIP
ncbi:hypothetical protein DITRI_Ditri04bG0017700 [Diplodiscus trichospermus]